MDSAMALYVHSQLHLGVAPNHREMCSKVQFVRACDSLWKPYSACCCLWICCLHMCSSLVSAAWLCISSGGPAEGLGSYY